MKTETKPPRLTREIAEAEAAKLIRRFMGNWQQTPEAVADYLRGNAYMGGGTGDPFDFAYGRAGILIGSMLMPFTKKVPSGCFLVTWPDALALAKGAGVQMELPLI